MSLFKLYIPLLEIAVAFAAIYLGPLGLMAVAQRVFGLDASSLWRRVRTLLVGFLFGTAVTLGFFFTFNLSWEQFAIDTVRTGATEIRRLAGRDPVDLCVARAEEAFRYTPESFQAAAARFSILSVTTLTPEQELLAIGNFALISGRSGSAERLWRESLRAYCTDRVARGRPPT